MALTSTYLQALSSPASALDAAPVNVVDTSAQPLPARSVPAYGPGSVPDTLQGAISVAPSRPDMSPDTINGATGGYSLATKGNKLGARLVGPLDSVSGSPLSNSGDGSENTLTARLAGSLGNLGKSSTGTSSVDTPLSLLSRRDIGYTIKDDSSSLASPLSSLPIPAGAGALKRQVDYTTSPQSSAQEHDPISLADGSGATLSESGISPVGSLPHGL